MTYRMKTRMRYVAVIMAVVGFYVANGGGTGVTAKEGSTAPTVAVAQELCTEPPIEEWCTYWEENLQCYEWTSLCFMINPYDPEEAQSECEEIGDSCGFGATAFLSENGCWWYCQIEQ